MRDALLAALGVTAADLDITRTLHGQELVYTIGFTGALAGAAGRALGSISVNASLIGIAENGAVASSASSMSSGRIVYGGIEDLTIGLGSGADVFHVRSTHTTNSTLNAGPGNDTLLIETITGTTAINGESGDDRLVLNPLPLKPTTANGINDDSLTFDGATGSDLYVINVFSVGDSEIVVHDSGTDLTGFDRLTINGTAGPRSVPHAGLRRRRRRSSRPGRRSSPTRSATSSRPPSGSSTTSRSTPASPSTVSAANDHFALDDNSSVMTVNGGAGEDTFQVGQMFGDTNDFDDDWPVALTATTRGQLSNGVSYATTLNGGDGPDHFYVFHNIGVLQLNGDAGDDEFVVRTFLGRDEETRIHAGGGRDLIQYIANAPVAIDGGDGFDSVVVIGTEADDDFVINADGVYGAGRFVSFIGVERVDIDGAEGDDTFTVLSTPPGVQIRIFGGLGSDTINVGADAQTVFADDLLGHSGVISSSVESIDGTWNGIHVDGVVAEIADNDAPNVIITESDGSTRVREGGLGDSYTIVLGSQPTANVVITVSAPSRSPDAERDRSYSVQLSLDGTTWTDAVTLVFAPGSWSTAQTVYVRAYGDFSSEGERSAPLQHLVVSGDSGFDGIAVPNEVVQVIDDDARRRRRDRVERRHRRDRVGDHRRLRALADPRAADHRDGHAPHGRADVRVDRHERQRRLRRHRTDVPAGQLVAAGDHRAGRRRQRRRGLPLQLRHAHRREQRRVRRRP